MSTKLANEVIKQCQLKGTSYYFLLIMAFRADAEDRCWLSCENLSEINRLSVRQCQRQINALEDAGYLKIKTGFAKNGRQGSNVYTVIPGGKSNGQKQSEVGMTSQVEFLPQMSPLNDFKCHPPQLTSNVTPIPLIGNKKEIKSLISPQSPPRGLLDGSEKNFLQKGSTQWPISRQHATRVDWTSPRMKRIAGILHPRGHTWTVYEVIALTRTDPKLEEIDLVEAFYHAKVETAYYRQSLKTLILHWSGEVDKASRHKDRLNQQTDAHGKW